jgi:hypothetical protein
MENVINGTPKATFYLNELASEITALFIEIKYENHYESIYQDGQDSEELNYKDYIQDEYNEVYDRIETYLLSNQIK